MGKISQLALSCNYIISLISCTPTHWLQLRADQLAVLKNVNDSLCMIKSGPLHAAALYKV